jgi:hypothetical protein
MLQMVALMRLFAACCATAFAQQQCDLVLQVNPGIAVQLQKVELLYQGYIYALNNLY